MYRMELNISVLAQTGKLIVRCENPATVFNRVDFVINGTGASSATIIGGNSQTFVGTGKRSITIAGSSGINTTFEFTIRNLTTNNTYKAPDAIWDIAGSYTPTCTGCTVDANGGLAKAYIKYANPDKKLRKVVVFVEGIDFNRDSLVNPDNNRAMRYGDFGWDVFYMGHKADTTWDFVKLMPNTRKAIQDKGYDMVLLDFRNGADYMQANGELLITLLKRLKNARVTDNDGVLHPISVIGASMGGQVAKYALAKMEKESPNDFCTNNYIAFDSPHKGANISISIQAMLEFLHWAGKSNRWETALLRPAARQLLQNHLANNQQLTINHWGDAPISSGVNNTIVPNFNHREDWLNTLASYGNYPTKSRKTAIACGNINAMPLPWKNDTDNKMFGMQVFSNAGIPINPFGYAGQIHLFSPETSKNNAFMGYVNTFNPPLSINNFNSYACCGQKGSILFAGAIPGTFSQIAGNDVPTAYHSSVVRTKEGVTLANWDAAPGCTRNDLLDVENEFRGQFPAGGDPELTILKNVKEFTFMPTVSALDINWPMDNVNMYKNIEQAKIIDNKLTPFEAFYAPETANLRHVEITVPIKDKLIEWITENERDLVTLPNSKGANYNFGFAKRWIPSMSINGGGILRINNEGATAYGSGKPSFDIVWDTYLFDCGGATVQVNTGGALIVGAEGTSTKKGVVHVGLNSKIILDGGLIKLQTNSQIIIEDGGKMFINSGTTTLVNGSQIIIKKGSQLTIKAGASININDNSQIIVEVGGTLIIEKGANSTAQFTGTGVNPNVLIKGELIVNTPIKMNGTAFKVTLLSTFEFTGQNKAQKMINLQENATLSLQNQSIVVRNGNITYGNYSKIILPASKIADLMDIGFNTDVTSIATTGLTNIGGVSPQILRIRDCEFNYLSKCIDLQHDEGQIQNSPIVFNITRSSFYQYKLFGVLLSNAHNLQAFSSSFSSEAITSVTSGSVCESCVLVTESKAPPAIIAMSIPSGIVGLKDCEIKGFGVEKFKERYIAAIEKGVNKGDALCFKAGNLYKLLNNEDGAEPCDFMDDFSYLVYLDDVPNFHLKGTNIHDAYVGILSRGNSNIIMSQGALLWNNGMGASMSGQTIEGNPTAALFFMDCSYMLDNIIGVSGRDVVLAIDEFVNSNSKNLNTFSNFMQDKISGLYFDIYHTFKPKSKLPIFQYQSQTQIPATNNTWKTGSPIFWNISLPSNLMEYDILQGFNATNAWVPAYELVVDPNAPSDQSVDCRIISNDDNPREVPPTKQGAVSTIIGTSGGLGTLWSGISAMLNENVEEMKAAFTPLAKVSDYERNNTENIYTQLYVDIAKALVYAPSDDVPIEVDGRNAKVNTTSKSSVLVYPNPAHQWLTVELPNQNHRLQLADGLGRSVYNETVNGTTRLNVGQYPSGVYHVIVTDANGIQTRSKVVVQHD